jgi:hypothetical protein
MFEIIEDIVLVVAYGYCAYVIVMFLLRVTVKHFDK